MAKFLANENVPRDVVDAARRAGHDLAWIGDSSPGADDDAVLAGALADGRVLVTFDKDFGEMAFHLGKTSTSGVILLRPRLRSPEYLAHFIVAVLGQSIMWEGGRVSEHPCSRDSPQLLSLSCFPLAAPRLESKYDKITQRREATVMSVPPPTPRPAAAEASAAWPRSAQLTTAFLLGVALTLVTGQLLSYTRLGARPSELARATHYRIDLNHADKAELLQLPGVGASLADRVDEYRHDHGGFQTVDDLRQVRGIGPTTLERLRPLVYVEEEPAAATGQAPRKPGKKETNLKEPIDVNRASATELQKLPGVGPKMSQRIVDERQKRPFKTVDELRRVSGIGPKTLDKLRPYVTVRNVAADVARE